MIWVKHSDDIALQKRHRRVSPTANWLLMCLVAYSNRELLDGRMDVEDLDIAQPGTDPVERAAALDELVAAGAVKREGDALKVEWLMEHQFSKAQVEKRREADKYRQQLHRGRTAQSQRDDARSHRPPSRPDPTRSRPPPSGPLEPADHEEFEENDHE